VLQLRAEGPSYPALAKLIATALVAALAASAVPLFDNGMPAWDAGWKLTFGTGAAFVVFGYLTVLTSRTGVDGDRIYQTGLLGKQVRMREVTQVRLVRVPWLSALIVPRLVARAGMLRTLRFPTADAEVLRLFELLAYGGGSSDAPAAPPADTR
jgi:hypothetical protein